MKLINAITLGAVHTHTHTHTGSLEVWFSWNKKEYMKYDIKTRMLYIDFALWQD